MDASPKLPIYPFSLCACMDRVVIPKPFCRTSLSSNRISQWCHGPLERPAAASFESDIHFFFTRIVENLEHISKWWTLFVGVHWCARCWFCGGKLPWRVAWPRAGISLRSTHRAGRGGKSNQGNGREGVREPISPPLVRPPVCRSIPPFPVSRGHKCVK